MSLSIEIARLIIFYLPLTNIVFTGIRKTLCLKKILWQALIEDTGLIKPSIFRFIDAEPILYKNYLQNKMNNQRLLFSKDTFVNFLVQFIFFLWKILRKINIFLKYMWWLFKNRSKNLDHVNLGPLKILLLSSTFWLKLY
jgi:hypothetical protein